MDCFVTPVTIHAHCSYDFRGLAKIPNEVSRTLATLWKRELLNAAYWRDRRNSTMNRKIGKSQSAPTKLRPPDASGTAGHSGSEGSGRAAVSQTTTQPRNNPIVLYEQMWSSALIPTKKATRILLLDLPLRFLKKIQVRFPCVSLEHWIFMHTFERNQKFYWPW